MNVWHEHIAGEHDDETQMQICVMCGALLRNADMKGLWIATGVNICTDRFVNGLKFRGSMNAGDVVVQCHDLRVIEVIQPQNPEEK
jgi:hypothetical protein